MHPSLDAPVNPPSKAQRWLDMVSAVLMPLALAVTLLLFAQWPLRDGLGRYSTQANDLAQWLFALYVAAALRHAGRRGAHLVARPDLAHADAMNAHAMSAGGWWPRVRRIGAPLCVLPWALYLFVSAAPQVLLSVRGLERFPESANPGYFMIKIALMLLALLMAAQSALDLWLALRKAARGH